MADILIFGDTVRSQELRHEVPLLIPDPFLYVERDGVRHIVCSSLEQPRLGPVGDHTFHPYEEYGIDELRRTISPRGDIIVEVVLRAVRALGVTDARVPAGFPVLAADRLRGEGVALIPDQELFDGRRRVKTGAELAGIRRAQAAADAGMEAARDLLAAARANAAGVLELEGRPLTSEGVKTAITHAFLERSASADEMIVSHGWQAAIAHHEGAGELRAGEPIVIDIWPRDNESACFADMTRTFVVGEIPDEVGEWHALCTSAIERALAEVEVGVAGSSLFDSTCDIFEAAGYPTMRTKVDGEKLDSGFFHSLGHGVGLSVHEEPLLGISGRSSLVGGDVIAVEPGLYRPGVGGVRIEDLVLVTDDGAEVLGRFPYELTP